MRDRHVLGEATYAALLEMALLGDERDLPWSVQAHVVGIVKENPRLGRRSSSDFEGEERPQSEVVSAENGELFAGLWWDDDSQDAGTRGRDGHVLDDAQLIRHVLPLALILQYLPTMANSVQVCVCVCFHVTLTLCPPALRFTTVTYSNRRGLTQRVTSHIFPMFAPLTGAVSRRSATDAEAQQGKSSEGDGAIFCPRRDVLGCLGTLHDPYDGASIFKV